MSNFRIFAFPLTRPVFFVKSTPIALLIHHQLEAVENLAALRKELDAMKAPACFFSWRSFFFGGLQSSNLYEKNKQNDEKKTGGAKSITFPQKTAMVCFSFQPSLVTYRWVGEFSSNRR